MQCCLIAFYPPTTTTKSLQLCPTLCDPIDGSPPGSLIPGILQARTLEWVAISFSSAWKWKVKVKSLSRVRPSATPWTAAFQAPPSMGFSRQEYWSGVPLPSPFTHLENFQNWSQASRRLLLLYQLSSCNILNPLLSFQQSSEHLHHLKKLRSLLSHKKQLFHLLKLFTRLQ